MGFDAATKAYTSIVEVQAPVLGSWPAELGRRSDNERGCHEVPTHWKATAREAELGFAQRDG